MRWDNLFDDLESQLEQELSAEEVDLRAEEERLRLAHLSIRDRLLGVHASPDCERMLRLELRNGSRIAATPSTFGRDWFVGEIDEESRRRPACVVPLGAIASVMFSRAQVEASLEAPPVPASGRDLSERLGLPFVLRDLCRRRQPLELLLLTRTLYGTLDRVGKDHCDLAVHEPGGVRRESAVTEYRTIALDQLLLVRL